MRLRPNLRHNLLSKKQSFSFFYPFRFTIGFIAALLFSGATLLYAQEENRQQVYLPMVAAASIASPSTATPILPSTVEPISTSTPTNTPTTLPTTVPTGAPTATVVPTSVSLDPLTVTLGKDRAVNMGTSISLAAEAENYQNEATLEYVWQQIDGPSVGALTGGTSVQFTLPDEVITLGFQVDVVDTAREQQVASDQVYLVVVRDTDSAIFVDADRGHDLDNGGRTLDSPVATLERSLEFDGVDIYLNNKDNGEAYFSTNTISLSDTDDIFGGFAGTNWMRDTANAPTPIMVAQAKAVELSDFTEIYLSGLDIQANAPVDGSEHSYAIYASDGELLTLQNVTAAGSDLTLSPALISAGSADFVSASSYGLFAQNVQQIEIAESTIRGGQGADGPKGAVGQSGAAGANGEDGGTNNDITKAGLGGLSEIGTHGGAGGVGGSSDTTCVAGIGGTPGYGWFVTTDSPLAFLGGTGGLPGGVDDGCTINDGGQGGVGSAGLYGSRGKKAIASTMMDGYIVHSHGDAGTNGRNGEGGGGGGGGAGNNLGDGGGGAGGGGGGEGGDGGFGGRGAGGSFGVALLDVQSITIRDSHIESGVGGTGGEAGAGGTGGTGGIGGSGSRGVTTGGDGGAGGRGGDGGNGGGGAGGPTTALLLFGAVQADVFDTQLITGNAGNGSGLILGIGGWNYGVYIDAVYINDGLYNPTNVDYQLGRAGNGSPSAAQTNQ